MTFLPTSMFFVALLEALMPLAADEQTVGNNLTTNDLGHKQGITQNMSSDFVMQVRSS